MPVHFLPLLLKRRRASCNRAVSHRHILFTEFIVGMRPGIRILILTGRYDQRKFPLVFFFA